MDQTVATTSTHDSVTAHSFNDNFSIGNDDADENEHDQLPSVEEYKANMIPGERLSESRMSSLNIDNGDDENNNNNNNDQLPSVEEYKASANIKSSSSSSNRRGVIFFLVVLFLCAVIIPLAILLPRNKDDGGSSSSTNNSSGSTDGGKVYEPIGNVERERSPTDEPLTVEEIMNHLVDREASTLADLSTPGTPQNLALNWLTTKDTYPFVLKSDVESDEARFLERYALAVLYYATSGPSWEFQMRFLSSVDTCDWSQNFKTLDGRIVRYGVFSCNIDGTIKMFGLPLNGLDGQLPDEIKLLKSIDTLVMQQNRNLTGSLPAGMGELTKLRHIELQYCGLTGSIPEWFGNLSDLSILGLGNNLLTGTIPFESLRKLTLLGVDDNNLDGSIDEFNGMLTDMRFLYLEDNNFDGDLRDSLMTHWGKTIEELDLSDNKLTGALPGNLFQPDHKMAVIDLNGNLFRGEIPSQQEQNTNLEFLALHQNELDGFVPDSLYMNVNLAHLDIARNGIIGTLPSSLGRLNKLRYLHTSDNEFTQGPLPEFVSSLVNLRELSMKDNNLNGEIPTWIGDLKSLQLLDLDSNDLGGSIPSEMGRLLGLDHLLLNRNELTGEIPTTFSNLIDLNFVFLDHNDLVGSLDMLCDKFRFNQLSRMSADCNGTSPEITCDCCKICCASDDPDCNQLEYFVNLDPIWEYGYGRQVYRFSTEMVPEDERND